MRITISGADDNPGMTKREAFLGFAGLLMLNAHKTCLSSGFVAIGRESDVFERGYVCLISLNERTQSGHVSKSNGLTRAASGAMR